MQDNRKNFTDNQKLVLYGQVLGRCPICNDKLTHDKKTGIFRNFEIAHIYPANPTDAEEVLLKNEKRLSSDVNSLDNVIAVCSKCHTKFDNPRTIEEYREWVKLKERLILDEQYKDTYNQYSIEDEIRQVLSILSDGSEDVQAVPLSYATLKIDQKTNSTMNHLTKRTIKNNVIEYYNYIREEFVEIDNSKPGIFDLIASQVKTAYLKFNQINSNQEVVFEKLVDWLNQKTKNISEPACEIIISYFIQNCEVFANDSTK